MARQKRFWRVLVTYGTIPNQTYARVPGADAAEKLKAAAIGLGYTDARIREEVEDETDEQEGSGTSPRGPARARRDRAAAR